MVAMVPVVQVVTVSLVATTSLMVMVANQDMEAHTVHHHHHQIMVEMIITLTTETREVDMVVG